VGEGERVGGEAGEEDEGEDSIGDGAGSGDLNIKFECFFVV
jgi:hypothetical protein